MSMDSPKLTKSIEDYIKVMYNLKKVKGIIRVNDIAEELNVKPPSVVEAVDRISRLELISHEKYGEIKLNKMGMSIAESVTHKHAVVKEFLDMLGIDNETIDVEACEMEHILSNSTINKLDEFTKFIEIYSGDNGFLKSFKCYEKYKILADRNKTSGTSF
jgi:DtxR family Mn-dependent transcriptional regulator